MGPFTIAVSLGGIEGDLDVVLAVNPQMFSKSILAIGSTYHTIHYHYRSKMIGHASRTLFRDAGRLCSQHMRVPFPSREHLQYAPQSSQSIFFFFLTMYYRIFPTVLIRRGCYTIGSIVEAWCITVLSFVFAMPNHTKDLESLHGERLLYRHQ